MQVVPENVVKCSDCKFEVAVSRAAQALAAAESHINELVADEETGEQSFANLNHVVHVEGRIRVAAVEVDDEQAAN